MIEEDDDAVCEQVVDGLEGALGRQVDALALTQAATAKDARLRARAALAYGRIAQEPGIAPLLQLLGDGDPQVRGTAAFSLGQLGWFEVRKGHEAELSAALAPLLGDADAGVRSRAIAALGLQVRVTGWVPTAENMPSANAYRPSDIIESASGQTIEIEPHPLFTSFIAAAVQKSRLV